MFKKSELEDNPSLIWIGTQGHWLPPPQSLEIELLDRKENLHFAIVKDTTTQEVRPRFYIGKGHHSHELNDEGREYFSQLRPQFGKVWIRFLGKDKPQEFLNYEDFLSEIAEK
jgi:hypothetical protein